MTTEAVDHPPHYLVHPSGVECINVTELMSFTLGNAVKYIWRAEHKNRLEDYAKALWYLRRHCTSTGMPSHPAGRVKQMLMQVAAVDDCPRRQYLLRCIANGDFERAIQHLEHVQR